MVVAVALALALPGASAWAGDADFSLAARDRAGEGLLFACARPSEAGCLEFTPRNDRFRALAGQLGMVFAPRLTATADTVGHAGFELSARWSGSFVASDRPYWGVTEAARATGDPLGLLSTLHLDARKGLPLSFELGASLMWLVDSRLFAPGLELRWALEDTHPLAPDLSLRGAVSHLVGQRDLELTTVGLEAVLSKELALGGVVEIAPFGGWAVLLTTARSGVVDPTPGAFVDAPRRADVENDFVFDPIELGDVVNHRLTVGARMIAYVVDIAVQGEFRLVGDDDPVTGVGVKFGLTY